METNYNRRKLFDDDEEDEGQQQNNEYNPQTQTEQLDSHQQQEYSYQPDYTNQQQQQQQQHQEQYQQPNYSQQFQQQNFNNPQSTHNEETYEYKPNFQEEPVSQYANERNNLMAEQAVEIDAQAHYPSMKENRDTTRAEQQQYEQLQQQQEQQKQQQQQQQQQQIKQQQQKQTPQNQEISQNEKILKEEAEKAKKRLIEDLNKMTLPDENLDEEVKEFEDPRIQKFTVFNPVKISGHIKYTVTGEDAEGHFEESRRYREFFALRNVLLARWPGIYIPAIPEKQLVNNKDAKFIEERRSLLERFMKELAKFDYLIQSKEFRIFSREKGDIEKILNSLIRQTPIQILEKYRLNFKIDEGQDANSMQRYKDTIMDFQTFLRKVISVMEIQKKQLKEMINIRDQQDKNYGLILTNMMKYEDQNIEYYSDSDLTKRILTHPSAGDMKEKVDTTSRGWKNSYRDLYIWLKGELLDIKGIVDAISGRENVAKQQSNCASKKRSDETELEKLSQGKKTLKTIFKSKSSKENDILNLQAAIEVASKDIGDYGKLINFLTIYHGEVAITKFKKEKIRQYLRALHVFCVREISNSHLSATLWHSLLEISSTQI